MQNFYILDFEELGSKLRLAFLLRQDGNEHIQILSFQIFWSCFWSPSSANVSWAFDSYITQCHPENNIMILKFAPHVSDHISDILQLLDVACFKSLKREWERCLLKCISKRWHRATVNQIRICQWVMCNLEYKNEER